MAALKRKLILTGGRAGQTVKLGKYQFVGGVTFVHGDGKDVDSISTYMGRCYKAWPEGSDELEYFQRLDKDREVKSGSGKVHEKTESGNTASVPSNVQPGREGSSEIPPAAGAGASGTQGASSSGSVPSGDGHQNAGDSEESFASGRLVESIKALDPDNNEHWTVHGAPRMDAVEKLFGSADIKRADVDNAIPNYTRDVAREYAATHA